MSFTFDQWPCGEHVQATLGGADASLAAGATAFVFKNQNDVSYNWINGDKFILQGIVISPDSTGGNVYNVVIFTDNNNNGTYESTDQILFKGTVSPGAAFPIVPLALAGPSWPGGSSKTGKVYVNVVAAGGASAPVDLAVTIFGKIVGSG